MSRSWPQVGKSSALIAAALTLFLVGSVGAQGLSLKRNLPGRAAYSCPPFDPPSPPGEEEAVEAGRLGSSANQALILGDLERARDLLDRATELNPSDPELVYRYARVLEDLGARMEAVNQFCRVMLMGSGLAGVGDARDRLQLLLASDENQVPDEAVVSFEAGLRQADSGNLSRAANSFGAAWNAVPTLAEAVYNRGLIQARLGRGEQAAADLQRYLTIRPDAEDAMLVSQAIGQLQALGTLPRPSAALGLGFLFPGAGQFYSGRAWAGLSVLTLSAGAVAAGFLIEEVTVRCVGTSTTGGECPPDRVVGEETDTPYLIPGLAAAGAVTLIGAIEAFFRARSRRSGEAGALVAMDLGRTRLRGPTLHASGSRVHVNLLQITF